MKTFFRVIFLACLALLTFTFLYSFSDAAVMQSTNYAIQSDSATGAGQTGATSSSYYFSDTLGEFAVGPATSTSFSLLAGYQEMQQTYLTIIPPSTEVILQPSIGGISGGTATGTAPFTVISDNVAGFSMNVNATPALVGAPAMLASGSASYTVQNSFQDYPTTPTYNWSVAAGNAQFGFTIGASTPNDAYTLFKNSGGACNQSSGSGNSGNDWSAYHCWAGFQATPTYTNVMTRQFRTDVGGESENLYLRANSQQAFLQDGTYKASITATVWEN